jgi:hypothetical protein
MSAPGFAGNKRIIDINGSGGAFISILATSTVRRLVVDESQITSAGAVNVPQGVIDYKLPNDGTANGFTTIFRAGAASEGIIGAEDLPIVLGSPIGQHEMAGEVIGQLGQPIVGIPSANIAAATTMIQVRSATATGTSVVVTEYN